MIKESPEAQSISSLNKLKETTTAKLGITLNPPTNEDTFSSTQNIFLGGNIGGHMTKQLIEIAEKHLIDKYKNK